MVEGKYGATVGETGPENQMYSSCLQHAFMIWFRSANSHTGRSSVAASKAGQMAASDYVPTFFKNRLHLAGRPQMSSRTVRGCRRKIQSEEQ
jgi:hypothetical protein